eukprot:76371-Rhodomonas_salina.2
MASLVPTSRRYSLRSFVESVGKERVGFKTGTGEGTAGEMSESLKETFWDPLGTLGSKDGGGDARE